MDLGKGPDFIGLGAQRCGTTWLYNNLVAHPGIAFPLGKEAHVLDRDTLSGEEVDRYLDAFAGHRAIVGEITPEYIWMPTAAERIERFVPESKLIALVRNPVDRAYSQYALDVRLGLVDVPFMEALEAKPEYMDRGRYFEQLVRYRDWRDEGRLAVYLYDDIESHPEEVVRSAQRFLGVEPMVDPSEVSRRANRGWYSADELLRRGIVQIVDLLRRYRLTRSLVDRAKRTRPGRWLGAGIFRSGEKQRLGRDERRRVWRHVDDDVEKLGEYIERPDLVERWRP